jgi:signal transduction histidine kinase
VTARVALDAADRARLVALHAVLLPALPAIAHAVAFADPSATAMFSGPEQMIDWMSTGLLGPHDEAFVRTRTQLERRHFERGLADIVASIGLIRRTYANHIVASYPPAEAHAVSTSVDKLLDAELALMLPAASGLAAESERRLEQVEAMRTLCAGLAHEVRNPLNSAKLQLELAQRRSRANATLVEPIALASLEIDRLTKLLDEFLAFAQPRALDARRQDVIPIVRDVIDRGGPRAEQCGVCVTLVAAPGAVVACVDAAKFHLVVESLVSNAIEAVTTGGRVTVDVVPVDGHVHIRVSDDGAGIPDDVLPRIYEPFFSTKEGGTGMGMSIAHSLVALHHGTIEVDSSPRGTTFDIAVPRGPAP